MEEQQKPILSNEEQYRAELAAIPRLGDAGQRECVERALRGDREAAERLIEDCMHVVAIMASRLSTAYLPSDYLDLVQIGNLELVEHLEQALEKSVPGAYLCGAARRAMRDYCFYHSRFIRLPVNPQLLSDAPQAVSLESSWLAEMAIAPHEQRAFDALYGDLDSALATLTEKQREAVKALYRLPDYEPALLDDLYRVHKWYRGAIQGLRRHLKPA